MTWVEFKEDILFTSRHPRVRAGLFVLTLAMLLGFATGVAYWLPSIRAYDELQVETDVLRREISSEEYNIKLADASGRAARQVALVETKLDAAVTQAILVQNMAMLARRNNVKILSEAYEEGKAKDGYAPLVHELMVQAGYAELRGFIAGVQQLPSLTIVQEASLARLSNSNQIKAQLNFITYRRAAEPRT